jgi:hypothetical protein
LGERDYSINNLEHTPHICHKAKSKNPTNVLIQIFPLFPSPKNNFMMVVKKRNINNKKTKTKPKQNRNMMMMLKNRNKSKMET